MSNPHALPLSSTGHVARARPASINVCGRPSGVCALCFTERVVASTDRSKMIEIVARGLEVVIPFGQRGRAPVLGPGSFWSGNPPTNFVYGSTGVDGGALGDLAGPGIGLRCRRCPPRCTDSDTGSQPSTMPL